MNKFIRNSGIALVIGGVLLLIINVFLTPAYMAAIEQGEVFSRSSDIYIYRISLAMLDTLLLLFGCIGLYLSQRNASGKFGTIAFVVVFTGNSLMFAVEWANLFVLRPVAQTSPETFTALNESTLMSAGILSGLGLFVLGWILMSVSSLLVNVFPRWAATSTIVGFVLVPVLGVTSLGVAGQVIGNIVLALGLAGMGYAVAKTTQKFKRINNISSMQDMIIYGS